MGGTPAEILKNAELMDLLLPLLRADLALQERYRFRADAPLDFPVCAMAGASDDIVSLAAINDWERQTTRTFSRYLFPGGHFFVRTARDSVLRLIARMLPTIG